MKIIIILLLMQLALQSSEKSINAFPLPIFGYAPETSWRVGVTTRFIFDFYKDSTTRKSNAKVSLSYTGLEQIIVENEWNYFFKGENWVTRGRTNYSKFREFYYGTGETDIDDEISIDINRSDIRLGLFYKIKENLFTGPIYKYLSYGNIKQIEGESQFSELKNSHVNSAGWTILFDSRKNLLNPIQGYFGEIAYFYNINDGFAESSNYSRINLDLRTYETISDTYTFAFRSINFFNIGDAPFYDLAQIGGEDVARGYLLGRHRSDNMMSFQSEFRFPFPGFTINVPFFGDYEVIYGLGIFGGVSRVFEEFSDFAASTLFPNYGLSFKWMIDKSEKINIRFDYGVGIGGESGFYIKFGESF